MIEGEQLAYYKDVEDGVQRRRERGRLDLSGWAVKESLSAEATSQVAKQECGFGLSDGTRELALSASSAAERRIWVDNLVTVTDSIWAAGRTTGLPGALRTDGVVAVSAPAWREASRDFTRTFVATAHGSGDIMLAGVRQAAAAAAGGPLLEPVQCSLSTGGNVNEEVNSAATLEFESIVQQILSEASIVLDAAALTAVSRRAVGHLTVTPSMQVLTDHAVPPAMFQNKFVLVAGSNTLRVATYGFVGEPVRGDRPDLKATPFVLRLLSPELLVETARGSTEGSGADTVEYAVRRSTAELISLEMRNDHARMLEVASTGEWGGWWQLGGPPRELVATGYDVAVDDDDDDDDDDDAFERDGALEDWVGNDEGEEEGDLI
eukprot:COSAG01_NODE_8210_length_2874_cov_1.873514_4_plen_378_part_00